MTRRRQGTPQKIEAVRVENTGPITPQLRKFGRVRLRGKFDVPLAWLHTLQETYEPGIAAEYAKGSREPRKPPTVVIVDGEAWLEDGHHRAEAARKRGDAELKGARVYVDAAPESLEMLAKLVRS